MRDPARLAGNDAAYVKYRVLPDMIPLGLCYRDVEVERVIHIVYTNVGAGTRLPKSSVTAAAAFSQNLRRRQRIELNAAGARMTC